MYTNFCIFIYNCVPSFGEKLNIAHKEKNHVYSDCKDNVISLMSSREFEIICAKGIALFGGSNRRGKLLLTKLQQKIELINQKFCSSAFF